jgi:hypothetical protein
LDGLGLQDGSPRSKNEQPQHPPDKKQRYQSQDNVGNPLACGFGLSEVKHAAIVAVERGFPWICLSSKGRKAKYLLALERCTGKKAGLAERGGFEPPIELLTL